MGAKVRAKDPVLWVLTLAASVAGLFAIFDAGYARSLQDHHGAIPSEFRSQAIWLVVAAGVGLLSGTIRASWWPKLARALFFLSLIGVALPLVPHLGVAMNGARRWVTFWPAPVQPAEFFKVTTVLFLAAVLANRKPMPERRGTGVAAWLDYVVLPKFGRWLPALLVVIGACLIESEPDLGTATVVIAIAAGMFLAGGVHRKTLLLGAALAIVGSVVLVWKQPYRMDRIRYHAERWAPQNVDGIGYQTAQSEAGMASGGILGVGVGNGRAKHVLPAATTDFVMATVGEEFGLVGVWLTLALLGAIVWRLFYQAARAPTPFASQILAGVGCWIGFQACVNVLMANATAPAIGIPMPFISSGGSSLVALWLAIGLSQSVLKTEESSLEAADADRVHRWRHRRPRLSGA